jgi:membrane fusion protein, multidrug efflux system
MKRESQKSKLRLYVPLAIIIIAVIVGGIYWYRDYSSYLTTDDARVDADYVSISSKITGRISLLHAEEGEEVKQGSLLAELDSSDLIAQHGQTFALKAQALANLNQAEKKYESDKKSLRVVEINLERASDDLKRAKTQSDGGVITIEQYDHMRKAYETASAQLDAAKAQLSVSQSMIAGAGASVETADAKINVITTQLKNTKLYSPADGVIAKRWLLPGDITQPGQSVFTLTMNKNLWVVAFPEETKISGIYAGQEAKFTLDAFPGVVFSGRVFLTGSSTASVFSLIPANNASGNFTKVTQRIPIRISIEKTNKNVDPSSFAILPGMSAVVKILRK